MNQIQIKRLTVSRLNYIASIGQSVSKIMKTTNPWISPACLVLMREKQQTISLAFNAKASGYHSGLQKL